MSTFSTESEFRPAHPMEDRSRLRLAGFNGNEIDGAIHLYSPQPGLHTEGNLALLPETDEYDFDGKLAEFLKPSDQIKSPTAVGLINARLLFRRLTDEANGIVEYSYPLSLDNEGAVEGGKRPALTLVDNQVDNLPEQGPINRTIGTLSKAELESLFGNFSWAWVMGIYKPSELSRQHSENWSFQWTPHLLKEVRPGDVQASPFATVGYEPNPQIAENWDEWDGFLDKMHELDKKVMLDFVNNHTGKDHPWVEEHQAYYVRVDEARYAQLDAKQKSFFDPVPKVDQSDGKSHYIAYGRDSNYDDTGTPWHDTYQLNYGNLATQDAMIGELKKISLHADGARCDMADLENPERFETAWWFAMSDEQRKNLWSNRFWPRAIAEVKNFVKQTAYDKAIAAGKSEDDARDEAENAEFELVAEVYDDKQKEILARGNDIPLGEEGAERGFDGVYGKDLRDHMRDVLQGKGGVNYQTLNSHLVDIATGTGPYDVLGTFHDDPTLTDEFGSPQAAMAVSYVSALVPGRSVYLLQPEQAWGKRFHIPMQAGRFPDKDESINPQMVESFRKLLKFKRSKLVQEGEGEVVQLDSSISDPSLIVEKYIASNENGERMGVMAVTNWSHRTAEGKLPGVGDATVRVESTYTGHEPIGNHDDTRPDGLFYVKLHGLETQFIYFDPDHPAERIAKPYLRLLDKEEVPGVSEIDKGQLIAEIMDPGRVSDRYVLKTAAQFKYPKGMPQDPNDLANRAAYLAATGTEFRALYPLLSEPRIKKVQWDVIKKIAEMGDNRFREGHEYYDDDLRRDLHDQLASGYPNVMDVLRNVGQSPDPNGHKIGLSLEIRDGVLEMLHNRFPYIRDILAAAQAERGFSDDVRGMLERLYLENRIEGMLGDVAKIDARAPRFVDQTPAFDRAYRAKLLGIDNEDGSHTPGKIDLAVARYAQLRDFPIPQGSFQVFSH